MKTLFSCLFCITLIGCAGGDAGKFGPYNTSSDGDDKRLMLNGYDPVAYHTTKELTRGKPSISTQFDGVVYRFGSEANKAEFVRSPDRYVPQFGGFCANGIVYGIPWGGDGDQWKVIDGKLAIFGGQASRNYFLMHGEPNMKLARQYWRDEVSGSNAIWQRYRRLVFRVPHYKTGAQLETEWQQSRQQPLKPASAQ